MERFSTSTIIRLPGGSSLTYATGTRRSILPGSATGGLRQPIELARGLAHDAGPQSGWQRARDELGRIAVPMREIAGEHQHPPRVEHLQHPVEMLRRVRLLDWLRGEQHMLGDDLARRPVEPWRGLPQRLPVLVETPEQRRQPGDAALDQHELQRWELLEHAFGDQADQVRHVTSNE